MESAMYRCNECCLGRQSVATIHSFLSTHFFSAVRYLLCFSISRSLSFLHRGRGWMRNVGRTIAASLGSPLHCSARCSADSWHGTAATQRYTRVPRQQKGEKKLSNDDETREKEDGNRALFRRRAENALGSAWKEIYDDPVTANVAVSSYGGSLYWLQTSLIILNFRMQEFLLCQLACTRNIDFPNKIFRRDLWARFGFFRTYISKYNESLTMNRN